MDHVVRLTLYVSYFLLYFDIRQVGSLIRCVCVCASVRACERERERIDWLGSLTKKDLCSKNLPCNLFPISLPIRFLRFDHNHMVNA